MGSASLFEQVWSEGRYALRAIRRDPAIALVAVLSMALGIGANTAVFSVINALMLRDLPVQAPHRLVAVKRLSPEGLADDFPYSVFEHLRLHGQSMQALVARFPKPLKLTEAGAAQWVAGVIVSANFHTALGVKSVLGRTLLETDELGAGGNPAVAMISHRFWVRRFGMSPDIVGRTINLNGAPVEVVGVAAPGFLGVEVGSPCDVWVPLSLEPRLSGDSSLLALPTVWWLELMGRLKPAAALGVAEAELTALFQQYRRDAAGEGAPAEARDEILGETISLHTARQGLSSRGEGLSTALLLLAAATGLLLLIACSNIANLLIARADTRRREIAVRLALGADHTRLIRQMLVESFLLAALGTALALLLSRWGNSEIQKALALHSLVLDIPLDGQVLSFSLALCLLVTLLCGLLPAWSAAGQNLVAGLRGSMGIRGEIRLSLRRLLVISQVAMSVLLVLVSGLLIRSLQILSNQELGFRPENVVFFRMDPGEAGYGGVKHKAFMMESMAKLQSLAGVASASFSLFTPLTAATWKRGGFQVAGRPPIEEGVAIELQGVGPGFFSTLSMRQLMGRAIARGDHEDAPRVGVVNQHLIEMLGLDHPIGAKLSAPPFGPHDLIEIVGVVADAKHHGLRDGKAPILYIPYYQMPSDLWGPLTVVVRTQGEGAGLMASIRREMGLDERLASVGRLRSMQEHIAASLRQERFITALTVLSGVVAALLASVGLGGLVSYLAKRRTREIVVRMALGARKMDVVKLVLREVVSLVAIGGIIGLAAAMGSIRFISSLLYGVTAADPWALGLTAVATVTIAVLAGYLPARRAAGIDPIRVLRCE